MTESISELYAEVQPALRLYRLMHNAYSNLIDNCPEKLVHHIRELNPYIFAELQHTLEEELDAEDAYALCALVEALREERGGKLW